MLLISLSLLCSCAQNTSDVETAKYAIIYTTDSGGKTEFLWLDDTFSEVATTKYNFSGASYDGFKNSNVYNGSLLLLPYGDSDKRDYGKIVLIDFSSGEEKTIDYGRTNITDWSEENGTVAIASNLNNESYIDVVNLQNKDRKSITMPDGLIAYSVIVHDGVIYAITGNLDDNIKFCRIDKDGGANETLIDIKSNNPPGFLQQYSDSIYFISEGRLIIYDIEKKNAKDIELTNNTAFNLQIVGDKMWIAYTDIHDPNAKSLIECRECSSGNVINKTTHDGGVLQMEEKSGELVVMDFDSVTVYDINSEPMNEIQHFDCEDKKGYYLGGFVLTD